MTSIDPEKKELTLIKSNHIRYDKLIIATGSTPFVPTMKGSKSEGVMMIGKDLANTQSILPSLQTAKNIVVIGAGFIGVEMSDELKKLGANVTLLEAMDSILPLALDKDMAMSVFDLMQKEGVTIRTNTFVDEILHENGTVSGVLLKNGETIIADRVIFAIGYKPNTDLAVEAGLKTGIYGGIITDEYLRTNIKDIYAIGDCAEHRDFFTGKPSKIMLASTAASEARILAINLFGIKTIRDTKGSIAIFSSSLGFISLGAAGLNVSQANMEGFDICVGSYEGADHHPTSLPNTSKQKVKLVFSNGSGIILGAQIIGGPSTGEMINILGLAIQKKMTALELSTMQYGTQPMLTSGPGNYTIVSAALDAVQQMC